MSFEDRLDAMADALYHVKQAMDSVKQLGANYLNAVDVLGDIQRSIEIDEAVLEQKLNEQWEREQRSMIKEYYQTV